MGNHVGRFSLRLLPVIMVAILFSSLSAEVSQAASRPGSARAAVNGPATSRTGDTTAASGLAPCTKPLFGPDKDCASTSPTVDRWVKFTGTAVKSCTYKMSVDWGHGADSSRIIVDPTPNVTYLIAFHTYSAEAQNTTYTETVTSTVTSGTCNPVPTTIFKYTHLLAAVPPWWVQYGITKACAQDLLPNPVSLGISAGLFRLPGYFKVLGVLFLGYKVYELQKNCVQGSYPLLPKAFSYGVKHLGHKFKPSGPVPQIPSINGIFGYQKSVLAYDSLTYANPGRDAKGFGFVGINGAGWALESHPFSKPSFGIVGTDRIDYPFNLACGTAQQFNSWVEAWIYDSQGLRSKPVEVPLVCTT